MLTVDATYQFIGDTCLVHVHYGDACLGMAGGPWSVWEIVGRDLRRNGTLPRLDDAWPVMVGSQHPPREGMVRVFLPGGTLSIPEGAWGAFCDRLLLALCTADDDRAAGAEGHYRKWAEMGQERPVFLREVI